MRTKDMNKLRIAIAVCTLMLTATAAAVELKIATLAPERTAWVQDMRKAAKEIKERTDGRVIVKLYVGGSQGDSEQVLRAVRTKRLHGGAFTPTDLQDRYADVNIYGLPFMFESNSEVDYVRGYLDKKLLQGLKEAGFISFGFTNGGFAYLMSNEPVRGLDDLKGKRVWVPEGDRISYAAMDALELSPVTLPITDVMTGLQTGLIDIVAFPPTGTLALQWHTKVKYLTEMPILFSMGLMAIDAKAFGQLDEADQDIVHEVMAAIYAEFSRREPDENRNAKDALLNSGVQSIMPEPGEMERIRKVMEKTNRQLGEQGLFSMSLYDEMVGHIEDYRSQQAEVADGD
jgi:TRAP-type C4-dicarboxylate transport system substrate-binding protein